jgi:hypothetical protein
VVYRCLNFQTIHKVISTAKVSDKGEAYGGRFRLPSRYRDKNHKGVASSGFIVNQAANLPGSSL